MHNKNDFGIINIMQAIFANFFLAISKTSQNKVWFPGICRAWLLDGEKGSPQEKKAPCELVGRGDVDEWMETGTLGNMTSRWTMRGNRSDKQGTKTKQCSHMETRTIDCQHFCESNSLWIQSNIYFITLLLRWAIPLYPFPSSPAPKRSFPTRAAFGIPD